ncbi:hypothetical protein [Microseira sp. BLCC-F43]|jgi:hypothetical protein|uniref:hypothetical protein n=1 Tax=Microseira sp. BLCC-F43 TaxID=3153602 RepID=UPI0035B966C7
MTERASLPKRWYQHFANIPIRVLLTVPFMLQLVGAVGIVGYLSAQNGQQSVRELADQLTQQVSLRIQDRLTSYLHAPQEVVAANHLAVEQGTFDLKDFEQLRQQFWQQVTLNPSLQSAFFGNELGEAIGYGRFQSECAGFSTQGRELRARHHKFKPSLLFICKLEFDVKLIEEKT